MNRIDRLSALVSRFVLDVSPAPLESANLVIGRRGTSKRPNCVWFSARNNLARNICDLSPAIVAMHEHPGKPWSIDKLAQIAGLSTSRFADQFSNIVGLTPMAYLRSWRMTLARQDVEQGDRVQTVASRYGYISSEAMSRAFKRHFGINPVKIRSSAACFRAVQAEFINVHCGAQKY